MNLFHVVVILLWSCQLVHPQQCRQQVTTVCDEPSASPFKGEKGDVGFPGKAGIAGVKGGKGEVGETGEKGRKGDSSTIDAFEEEIRQKLEDLAGCSGGVIIERICYRLPYKVGSRLNYTNAEELCFFQGSQLAEIPTREVYDVVYDYIKTTWSVELEAPSNRHIGIWFGMRYENGRAILRNGSTAFTSWLSGHPYLDSNHSYMGMQAPTRPNGPEKGMWNLPPTLTAVPLCEFRLE